MPFWLWFLVLGLPIAWLVAEFKASRPVRIVLGLLAIVVFYWVVFIGTQVVRGYEHDFMMFSLEDMHRLLRSGRTGEVSRAIEVYQAAVTNDTPFSFQGASALHRALRQMNTNSEQSAGANLAPR
ncbi:MAG TPA: hypothetical protein VL171_02040 [Verrucomicrobiae bacterium]|nr:hypothetical protein [Verrucomicrobiae bacterium]